MNVPGVRPGGLFSPIATVIYSLQRFLKLLAEGQTVALDMLFAPDRVMTIVPTPLWREIQANSHRFISRRATRFVAILSATGKQIWHQGLTGRLRAQDAQRVGGSRGTLWYRQCLACSRRAAGFHGSRCKRKSRNTSCANLPLRCKRPLLPQNENNFVWTTSRKQHWRKDYLIPSPLSWERARGEVARRASKIALRLRALP